MHKILDLCVYAQYNKERGNMKILLDMLIVEYMIENKLSVNKFCKKCGVSQDMILNERGHFDLVELMKIVETFNLKSQTF